MLMGDGFVHPDRGNDERGVSLRCCMKDEAAPGHWGFRVRIAASAIDRIRGLLFSRKTSGVLALVPCCDIHTFGMKEAIDVAFIDEEGRVLDSRRAVGPCRRLRCKGAVATLERFVDDGPWPERGNLIGIELLSCAKDARREEGCSL